MTPPHGTCPHCGAGPMDEEELFVHKECCSAPFGSRLTQIPYSAMPAIGEILREFAAAKDAEIARLQRCIKEGVPECVAESATPALPATITAEWLEACGFLHVGTTYNGDCYIRYVEVCDALADSRLSVIVRLPAADVRVEWLYLGAMTRSRLCDLWRAIAGEEAT